MDIPVAMVVISAGQSAVAVICNVNCCSFLQNKLYNLLIACSKLCHNITIICFVISLTKFASTNCIIIGLYTTVHKS